MTAPTTLYYSIKASDTVEISIDDYLDIEFGFFNAKIDYFAAHPNYEKLRNIADTAIMFIHYVDNEDTENFVGRNPAVASAEFISEIEHASLKEIKELLDAINERID